MLGNKRNLSKGISNPRIDEIYDIAINAGAFGGKLCGTGGGGFALFYVPNEEVGRQVFDQLGLRRMMVNYGVPGSMCILDDREK